MPCSYCFQFFTIKPCEPRDKFPTGNIYTKELANKHYPYTMEVKFGRLSRRCPCINCLVKIACDKRNECQEYIDKIVNGIFGQV